MPRVEPANGISWKRGLPRLIRWLHTYLSMVSFALVFFFAATGLTLNHADKFGSEVRTRQAKGTLNPQWVKGPDTSHVAKLEIVEYLRNTHRITAAVSDFRIDDAQVSVSFKGPGFAADVFIDRETGHYDIAETSAGFIGLINDLHKGRDTGDAWRVFIDISAVLLVLISLTGILLLLYLRRRRLPGLVVAALGTVLGWLIYIIWVK
jgi:hypothetical protein